MNHPKLKPPASRPSQKKSTNISLSKDVSLDAKEFGLNISQLCEQKPREEIAIHKEKHWNAQHAEFISAYNKAVEEDGVALQEWRAY